VKRETDVSCVPACCLDTGLSLSITLQSIGPYPHIKTLIGASEKLPFLILPRMLPLYSSLTWLVGASLSQKVPVGGQAYTSRLRRLVGLLLHADKLSRCN